jgi:hypothetical protein
VDAAVASSAPPGPTYYRLTVPRSNVSTVCSLGHAGEGYKTYLPLEFEGGAVRMIKPLAKSYGCDSAKAGKGGASSGLQMTFRLLDNAQVGIVDCPPRRAECEVFLYRSTGSVGYNKEQPQTLNIRHTSYGRTLLQANPDDCTGGMDTCITKDCDGSTTLCYQYRIVGDYGICYQCGTCFGPPCTTTHPNCNAGTDLCCFPADAVVTTLRGATRISALKIGDKVLAARPDGSTFFDDVYMFGHKDTTTAASFVRLETAGGAALRLTSDHHLFVTRGGERLGVPASQALVGDLVHVQGRLGASQLEAIVAKSIVRGTGLFNPYTLSGSIVVDGVAASCHSSSALDGVFRLMGVSIPDGYQAAFAPLRTMYRALGADRMASIEFIVDAVASAANTGTLLSALGPVASAVAGGAWLAARMRAAS